jgi:hypothetical protein
LVLAAAGGPPVVTLIGCNVDSGPNYNGLPNELINRINSVPILSLGDGGGPKPGDGGTTGTAMSLCDTAESLVSGAPACSSCNTAMCNVEYTACKASTCGAATTCVFNCGGVGSCIANCIAANPAYETLMQCLLASCASSCGLATPLSCPLSDGGPADSGPQDAATGG